MKLLVARIRFLFNLVAVCFSCLLIINTPYAQAGDTVPPTPTIPAGEGGQCCADKLIGGFGQATIKKEMFKPPADFTTGEPLAVAQGYYLRPGGTTNAADRLMELLLQNIIAPNGTENLATVLGACPGGSMNPFACAPNQIFDKEPMTAINIANLIEPLVYSKDQAAAAQRVIQSLVGATTPLPTMDFDSIVKKDGKEKAKRKLGEAPTQDYLSALRAYMAAQSLALNNLYFLYAERMPIDTNTISDDAIKHAVNTVSGSTKDLSALKLENLMATRRITDENWYKSLLSDNPAALQREQITLLAEASSEIYNLRATSERILATMSVLTLQLNQQTRGQLINQLKNTVQGQQDTTPQPAPAS